MDTTALDRRPRERATTATRNGNQPTNQQVHTSGRAHESVKPGQSLARWGGAFRKDATNDALVPRVKWK